MAEEAQGSLGAHHFLSSAQKAVRAIIPLSWWFSFAKKQRGWTRPAPLFSLYIHGLMPIRPANYICL